MVEISSWKVCAIVVLTAAAIRFFYQRLYHLPLKMDGYSDRNFRDVAQTFRRIKEEPKKEEPAIISELYEIMTKEIFALSSEMHDEFLELWHLIQREQELGGSFAVYYEGQKVLDMVGGYADPETELPWTHDTLTQVFSLSSISAALSFFHLQSKQTYNLTVPVKNFWAKFEHETLTVGELLQQRHSLYRLREETSIREVMDDPSRLDDQLAFAHESIKDDGKSLDGKFFTLGLYTDAVFRRVDTQKRSISQYFYETFAYPLSLDAHLGLPRTQFSRAARVKHRLANGLWAALWSLDIPQVWRSLGWNSWWEMATEGTFSDYKLRWAMRADGMEVGHASLNLFANARSMARLMAAVAGRGMLDNRQAIDVDKSQFELLHEVTTSGYDRTLSGEVSYNRYGMEVIESPVNSKMVGLYGFGGQFAYADLEKKLAFAYTSNHLHLCSRDRDFIAQALITSIYECISKFQK